MFSSKKGLVKTAATVSLLICTVLFAAALIQERPFRSVEYGVTALSPKGEAGGFLIPASCGSPHTGDTCTAPDIFGPGGSHGFTILAGHTATITWDGTQSSSTSCDGTNFSTGGALSGSVSVAPSATTDYTVTCGPNSGTITVTVINPTISISASPATVRSGDTTTITWSATSVNSCTVTGPGVSTSGSSGSLTTPAITSQSTYTLSCSTDGGTVTATTTVSLQGSFGEF
jgi:hypothetical protein